MEKIKSVPANKLDYSNKTTIIVIKIVVAVSIGIIITNRPDTHKPP